jgi:hypothetical protein
VNETQNNSRAQSFRGYAADNVKNDQRRKTKAELQKQQQRILNFKSAKGFRKTTKITDTYALGKELGSGSFGSVRLGHHL